MYCPKCGKENSEEQRFCRVCGLSLQMISQLLVNELSAPESYYRSIEAPKSKGMQNPLVYGMCLILLGLVVIFMGKTILAEQLIADIGTLVAFLGIGFLGYRGVSLLRQQPTSSIRSKALPKSAPTNKLLAAPQSGGRASVTEHTTRLFEPIYSERQQ